MATGDKVIINENVYSSAKAVIIANQTVVQALPSGPFVFCELAEKIELPLGYPIEQITFKVSDQSWYWSPKWQEVEKIADKDLAEGSYESFENLDDFIRSL